VSATPTLTWQASSDTGCGLDKYQLWIDGMLNRDDISPSVTSTTPVAPLSLGPHTWKIVAVDGASSPNDTHSETRSFTVGEGTLGPKQVALKAKPKKVEKGKKVKLTATVSPCAGHDGDHVELFRGSKKIAAKATNDACVARFKVKMKKTARFRAVSPQQDDDHLQGRSKKIKVRVV
jgi:hypothetical protein